MKHKDHQQAIRRGRKSEGTSVKKRMAGQWESATDDNGVRLGSCMVAHLAA